jgi:hypothetical protein
MLVKPGAHQVDKQQVQQRREHCVLAVAFAVYLGGEQADSGIQFRVPAKAAGKVKRS